MAKAKKLPSGSWRVKVSTGTKDENGNYIYESITRPTEKEANYAALELELKYKSLRKSITNMTLLEAMQAYIDSKDGILSPSTLRSYSMIKKNNLQRIMPLNLNKLTQSVIQSAINDESKTHSPKTVHNIYGLLSAVLKEYYPTFELKIKLPPKNKTINTLLNAQQLKILLDVIKDSEMEIPILLAVWLGLRQSEICGLKWNCIDIANRTLTIKEVKVRNSNNEMVLKKTKTYSSTRVLEIPTYILNKLEVIQKDGEFITQLKGHNLYERFQTILRQNNLPLIRFHDLRHLNASIMLALNIPDKYAMERGGWATNYTMKNVYQQTMEDERKVVDSIVNDYFEKLLCHDLGHENSNT